MIARDFGMGSSSEGEREKNNIIREGVATVG
jgi:hypothetical protein